jgi:hypothetical protein
LLYLCVHDAAVVAYRNGPADHVDLVDKLQKSLKLANKVHQENVFFENFQFPTTDMK